MRFSRPSFKFSVVHTYIFLITSKSFATYGWCHPCLTINLYRSMSVFPPFEFQLHRSYQVLYLITSSCGFLILILLNNYFSLVSVAIRSNRISQFNFLLSTGIYQLTVNRSNVFQKRTNVSCLLTGAINIKSEMLIDVFRNQYLLYKKVFGFKEENGVAGFFVFSQQLLSIF